MTDDALIFAEEAPATHVPSPQDSWKILIVDDEHEVHSVTEMALRGLEFDGRRLEFLNAYTGAESLELMRQHDDIAVVLMDVVMETEHAGLEAVRKIREELKNKFVRIILRTGQPGQAPERVVIAEYDINDYKEKTELTATKLFTVIFTALGSYRDLVALEHNRQGLEKVIEASATLMEERSIQRFAQGVLEQLAALLHLTRDAVLIRGAGVAAAREANHPPVVLAGIGQYEAALGAASDVLGEVLSGRIADALRKQETVFDDDYFLYYFRSSSDREIVLYLDRGANLNSADSRIVELFCRNVGLALDNLYLNEQLSTTQGELIMMLSEAIEKRSAETGNHVRRVAAYAALLGKLHGLSEEEIELLRIAAPLHDAGKVAIPDAILHKPGPHNDAESAIMRSHAAIGEDLFEGRDMPVLRAAALIAGQHHEQWDGRGYPHALAGESIHIFGRLVALADVFDALLSKRCYKQPWELDEVLDFIKSERGGRFDPALVDLLIEHLDEFQAIGEQWSDVPADHDLGQVDSRLAHTVSSSPAH